jgi:hypothetical protein
MLIYDSEELLAARRDHKLEHQSLSTVHNSFCSVSAATLRTKSNSKDALLYQEVNV